MSNKDFDTRPYDIVIFGATGFSGKWLAEYLVKNHFSNAKLALAGRNQAKLEAVREGLTEFDSRAKDLPILIGNSDNLEQLVAIAKKTRVVASTVGPYMKYGTPLVEACATTGTSYCDLTGEGNWHQIMYNRFERDAEKTGARVVLQAGFDSVPSDLGTMFAAKSFREKYGRDAEKVEMYISMHGGGVQGGTIDTALNEFENAKKIAAAKKESRENAPPMHSVGKTTQSWVKGLYYDEKVKRWCVPFFMAPANQPYVSRSNGRLGYSSQFTYQEAHAFRSLFKASMFYGGLLMFGASLSFAPTRYLLKRFVLPAPGQGPSREVCEAAAWKMTFVATGGNDRLDVQLNATGDPSCISTVCCLGESAMALSVDSKKLESPGGIITAAAAMGDVLLERIRASGFFKIEVVDSPQSKL